MANVQVRSFYHSFSTQTHTRRLALANVALQVPVAVEASAVGDLQTLRLQLVDGAATIVSLFVLAYHLLDGTFVDVRILHEEEFLSERNALANVCPEHAKGLCEQVLVLLAGYVHHVIIERFRRVDILVRHLSVMSDTHAHLSDDVIRLGHDIKVGDAILAVEEGLPYHGWVGIDMSLYHEDKKSRSLCEYTVGRSISHIAIRRLSAVP